MTDSTDLAMFRYIHKELFNRSPDLQEIQHFKTNFFNSLRSSYLSFPKLFTEVSGAKQFVEQLYNGEEWKLAIATGCWSESASIKLKAIGLEQLNIPISSSDAIMGRQHILSNACILAEEHYRSEGFEKIYYFGDGMWDYQSAKALDLKFVGVDFNNNNTFYDAKPDFVIKDFVDVGSILDKL